MSYVYGIFLQQVNRFDTSLVPDSLSPRFNSHGSCKVQYKIEAESQQGAFHTRIASICYIVAGWDS